MDQKLIFLFVFLALYVSLSIQKKVHHTHACEGHKMKLFCPKGWISVEHADYGRSNATICPYFDDPNMVLNCHSKKAKAHVEHRCNGKVKCRVAAVNDIFGDPCPGQVKYVEARYTCVHNDDVHPKEKVEKALKTKEDSVANEVF